MPDNQANPKGFWERKDVYDFEETCFIPPVRLAPVVLVFDLMHCLQRLSQSSRKRQGKSFLAMDAHRPWFLKEPRLCMLAPLWLELLEFPVCVFVHRSPLEVARSLEMRNGFSLAFGLALWERYNTAALNATRGSRRIQVNHAELMAAPVAAVRTLAQGLEAMGVRGLRSPSDEEILAFIDPSLYRAKAKRSAASTD